MLPTLLILGGGNMGGALIRGWLKSNDKPQKIILFDSNKTTRQTWRKVAPTNLLVLDDLNALNSLETKPTFIVLAVKPDGIAQAITSLRPYYENEPPPAPDKVCLISVAAGKRVRDLQHVASPTMVVLRAMPNLPVEVAQGVVALYGDDTVPEPCYESVAALFSALGTVVRLKDESLLSTITALCGSGPAYVYAFMEGLQKAAIRHGLSSQEARDLDSGDGARGCRPCCRERL